MAIIDLKLLQLSISFFPDAALIINESHLILAANKQIKSLLGYEAKELIGENFVKLVPEPYRTKHKALAQQFIAEEDVRQMGKGKPLWALQKNGALLEIDIALRSEQTEVGKVIVVSVRDLSNIRRYEKEIIRRNEHLQLINIELEKFAHIVSHDLKSPLKQVKALSDLLLMEFSEEKQQNIVDILQHLRGSVESMERLIHGILEYSELGRSKDLQQSEVNLNQIVQEIKQLVSIPDTFTLEIPDKLPIIKANPIKILQVMMNLITNAIKYNDKEEGLLSLQVKEDKGYYHFIFEDNGVLVDKNEREKIFALFVREYEQHKQQPNSHGIGLATTKKIIEDQGGKIWYDESRFGGSAFHFTWPQ